MEIALILYIVPLLLCLKYCLLLNILEERKLFSDSHGFARMSILPVINWVGVLLAVLSIIGTIVLKILKYKRGTY